MLSEHGVRAARACPANASIPVYMRAVSCGDTTYRKCRLPAVACQRLDRHRFERALIAHPSIRHCLHPEAASTAILRCPA